MTLLSKLRQVVNRFISWMGKPIEMLDGNKGNTIKTFDGANNKVKEGGGGGAFLSFSYRHILYNKYKYNLGFFSSKKVHEINICRLHPGSWIQ